LESGCAAQVDGGPLPACAAAPRLAALCAASADLELLTRDHLRCAGGVVHSLLHHVEPPQVAVCLRQRLQQEGQGWAGVSWAGG
jgi:hypothetical protein